MSRSTSPSFSSWRSLLLPCLVLGAVLCVLPVWADYPEPRDDHVNDFAGLLDGQTEVKLRRHLVEMRETRGLAAVVVTVDSFRGYDVGAASIEEFASGLFDTWGIGDAETNRGALLLVGVSDRQVRIELGASYAGTKDAAMLRVIDREIVPRFKQGHFAQGIESGTLAMTSSLLGIPRAKPARRANPGPERPVEAVRAPQKSTRAFVGWGAAALSLIAVFGFAVPSYRRHRARSCPDCSAKMRRLSEMEEDAYLDESQQAEENVGSVDYDVWLCEGCGEHDIQRFGKFFTSIKECPDCSARTLEKRKRVVRRPTRKRQGKKRITEACLHCEWSISHTVLLPMLSDNTSNNFHGSNGIGFGGGGGGGSSFGGGSSGGGGASGTW